QDNVLVLARTIVAFKLKPLIWRLRLARERDDEKGKKYGQAFPRPVHSEVVFTVRVIPHVVVFFGGCKSSLPKKAVLACLNNEPSIYKASLINGSLRPKIFKTVQSIPWVLYQLTVV